MDILIYSMQLVSTRRHVDRTLNAICAHACRFEPGQLYHPNVNRDTGEICADTITKCFGPTKNVTDLARMVQQFLQIPNPGA